MSESSREPIDFVITWVDMNDPAWQEQYRQYSGTATEGNATSVARFRDHGLLKYWFRAVEAFCPWVHRIFFVTCGQHPDWLRWDDPRLVAVDHKDYIPEEALPTFNSSLIEMFLHRIPGISERFVYFNDDFFPLSPVPEERFFQDGLPCDIAAFRFNSGIGLWSKCLWNNLRVINARFDKQEVLKRDRAKWFHPSYGSQSLLTRLTMSRRSFLTLKVPHNAQPYLRSTFEEVWDYAGEELRTMLPHRFRDESDFTQELFRTWQICRGRFVPYNTYVDTKMYPLALRADAAVEAIRKQKYRLVCLNDNARIRNYDAVMARLAEAWETILPEKSRFEV